ncbi:hypothetical protein AMECASPLE_021040 [Ameca splendens]|uniref:Uncharacterized protein n=1 Tax=Ameca splendens TaxID=208324 RepID=A0ABV0XSJ8_9TELE
MRECGAQGSGSLEQLAQSRGLCSAFQPYASWVETYISGYSVCISARFCVGEKGQEEGQGWFLFFRVGGMTQGSPVQSWRESVGSEDRERQVQQTEVEYLYLAMFKFISEISTNISCNTAHCVGKLI